jgi:hypothetical protein
MKSLHTADVCTDRTFVNGSHSGRVGIHLVATCLAFLLEMIDHAIEHDDLQLCHLVTDFHGVIGHTDTVFWLVGLLGCHEGIPFWLPKRSKVAPTSMTDGGRMDQQIKKIHVCWRVHIDLKMNQTAVRHLHECWRTLTSSWPELNKQGGSVLQAAANAYLRLEFGMHYLRCPW